MEFHNKFLIDNRCSRTGFYPIFYQIRQGQDGSSFEVTRYSPEGNPECKGIFKPEGRIPQLDKPYDITYPSHCRTVTLLQGGSMIRLSTF